MVGQGLLGGTEGDAFGSLPQAIWGRGRRDAEHIYLGLCHKVGNFKLYNPWPL